MAAEHERYVEGVRRVSVSPGTTLGRFLQVAGAVSTGGQAKALVQEGAVTVDGVVETRRGHRLADGSLVEVGRQRFRVMEREEKPRRPKGTDGANAPGGG